MHENIVEIQDGNIGYSNGVTAFFYEVIPFNTIYSEDAQIETLLENFSNKISRVNMPGQLMILPEQVQGKEIVEYYTKMYNKHGFKDLEFLAKDVIQSLIDTLKVATRYRYKIFLVFTQDRNTMEKSIMTSWRERLNLETVITPDKYTLEIASEIEKSIFGELTNGLNVKKVSELELSKLVNYLAIPLERECDSWYYTQDATTLEYDYYPKQSKDSTLTSKKLYTRQLIATEMPVALDGYSKVFNNLQMKEYPVDIVMKFDILQPKKFINQMESEEVKLKREMEKERDALDFVKGDTRFNYHLAKGVIEHTTYQGETTLEFQIMLRLRGDSKEILEKRYTNLRRHFGFEIKHKNGYMFSYEVGRQESLFKNMNPFNVTVFNHIHKATVDHVAKYNWFGGQYLGDTEGLILGATRPGHIPVYIDPFSLFARDNLKNAPTIAVVGQTGSGKSQLANNISIMMLAIFGMAIFDIDPKGGVDGQHKLYSRFPEGYASHLIIGSSDTQRGMFDPFNDDTKTDEKKEQDAISILTKVARVYNKNVEINTYNIIRSIEDVKNDPSSPRVTCLEIAKQLVKYDKLNGENMIVASRNKFGQLYFAHSNDKPFAFDLDKYYNLITFESVPSLQKNPDDIDLGLFNIMTGQISVLIDTFKTKFLHKPKVIKIDEVSVFNSTAEGHLVIENLVKTARSALVMGFIMDQKYETLERYLSECGYQILGNIEDIKEIDNIIKQLHLDDNDSIKKVLTDTTQHVGIEDDMKYRFLYRDADNQTGVIKADLMTAFKDVLHPLKEVNSEVMTNEA